jgi:nicotinamide-nucleotide amidase
MNPKYLELAQKLGQLLEAGHLSLAGAESCTGGEVAQIITSISRSSGWFERGFVTYSNQAKMEMLGVNKNTLDQHGAVSEETAKEMAEGALKNSHADVSFSITGIAGPDGGTKEKPVGLVWFGFAGKNKKTVTMQKIFSGDRLSIRDQASEFVLEKLLVYLK